MDWKVSYFSHCINMANSLESARLFNKYGVAGYGLYWIILEKLAGSSDYKISLNDVPDLSWLIRYPEMKSQFGGEDLSCVINEMVKMGLLVKDDTSFWCETQMEQLHDSEEAYKNKREHGKLGGRPKKVGYDIEKGTLSETETYVIENEKQREEKERKRIEIKKEEEKKKDSFLPLFVIKEMGERTIREAPALLDGCTSQSGRIERIIEIVGSWQLYDQILQLADNDSFWSQKITSVDALGNLLDKGGLKSQAAGFKVRDIERPKERKICGVCKEPLEEIASDAWGCPSCGQITNDKGENLYELERAVKASEESLREIIEAEAKKTWTTGAKRLNGEYAKHKMKIADRYKTLRERWAGIKGKYG